ncbi:MAG: hypothetical protein ACLQG5_00760 [Methanobacterium sp.]
MINNKIIAIIAAIIAFILGSILVISIIFYFFGYPLSSIFQHQTYAFSGILVGVILASIVYGNRRKELAMNLTQVLDDSLDLEIKEEDVKKVINTVQRIPPFLINVYVDKDMNAVESFKDQISKYKSQLTDEDKIIIRRILEMPIPELQNLLNKSYLKTNLEQFKILAEPKSEAFLTLNLKELKKILIEEDN